MAIEMSQDERAKAFIGGCLASTLCWYFALHVLGFRSGDLFFFAIMLGIFSSSSFLIVKEENELITAALFLISGLAFSAYISENGYKASKDGTYPTPADSYFDLFIFFILGSLSFGLLAISCYVYLHKFASLTGGIKKPSKQKSYRNEQYEDFENSQEYDYDPSRFNQSSRQNNAVETPYGFDKLKPEHMKYWNVIHDPNSSETDKKLALNAIMRDQAKEKGNKGKDLTI